MISALILFNSRESTRTWKLKQKNERSSARQFEKHWLKGTDCPQLQGWACDSVTAIKSLQPLPPITVTDVGMGTQVSEN